MFKLYQKYILKKFFNKFFLISFVFLCLAIVLNIFEEISFFKNSKTQIMLPYFLTLLNAPIILFEIFPFIFLIAAQFFFFDLYKNKEMALMKTNGLSNFKIIKTLFISSFLTGFILIIIYYNFASKLKFFYTDIKNTFSNDNKYLAMVNDTGLWLKDEVRNDVLIVKSKSINDNLLLNVIINKFNSNFQLEKTIQAEKMDISTTNWIIYNPIITEKNISVNNFDKIRIQTNFDSNKIRSLFSNFSTLDLFELFNLKNDYEKLGYSSDEIEIHLLKLFSSPYLYALMTILSSIIMINIRRNHSIFFNALMGIFISVMIYYLNFMFISLGNTGKIPPMVSVILPLVFLTILSLIGLVRINEK